MKCRDFMKSNIMRKMTVIKLTLFLFFLTQCLLNLINKSTTYDGCKHLETGLNFIRSGKCCDGIDNTPMTVINSAPAYFLNKFFKIDISCKNELHPPNFVYRYIPNKYVMFIIGLPTVFLGLLGAVYVYKFTTQLFGSKAGLLSLFFYSFCPNIIAHSSLNTQDAPMAVFSLIAFYYFYKLYKKETNWNAIIAGITLGLALGSKLNAVLIWVSYFIIFYFYYILSKKNISLKHLILVFLVGYFILNSLYRFDGTFSPISTYGFKFKSSLFLSLEDFWPKKMPLFLPQGYLVGLDNIAYNNTQGWGNYLFGKYIGTASFLYFGVVLLLKTPIPTLILFFLYILTKNKKFDEVFIIIPLAIFLLFNLFLNRLALGLRFFLVIYPLVYILISDIIIRLERKVPIISSVLIIWCFLGTIRITPHYLAYFNEFIGGPQNGYKYLADSNIDWGQENFFIEDYISKADKKIFKNPGCIYTSGIVAINLNSLMGISGNPWQDNSKCYSWIKSYPLIDRVGYTWFIYDTRSGIR